MCNDKNCYIITIIECEETGKKCYVHYDKNNNVIFEEGDLILKDYLKEAERKENERLRKSLIDAELDRYEGWNDENIAPIEVMDIAGNVIVVQDEPLG